MIYLFAILGYLFLLTGIGIYKARQVRTKADFSVAGRSLSPGTRSSLRRPDSSSGKTALPDEE